jgi:hypothetical protein
MARLGLQTLQKARDAVGFFKSKVKDSLRQTGVSKSVSRSRKRASGVRIGSMYTFAYWAKWDKTLPTWDKFPLVFPIAHYKDGFLGINLHYLPITVRFKLLKQLMAFQKGGIHEGLTDESKLHLTYDLLKTVVSPKVLKVVIKRYLYKQVRSKRFSYISPLDWKKVVFLPTADWIRGKPY